MFVPNGLFWCAGWGCGTVVVEGFLLSEVFAICFWKVVERDLDLVFFFFVFLTGGLGWMMGRSVFVFSIVLVSF